MQKQPGENSESLVKVEVELGKLSAQFSSLERIWREYQGLYEQISQLEGRKEEAKELFENAKKEQDFDLAAKIQRKELPAYSYKPAILFFGFLLPNRSLALF